MKLQHLFAVLALAWQRPRPPADAAVPAPPLWKEHAESLEFSNSGWK